VLRACTRNHRSWDSPVVTVGAPATSEQRKNSLAAFMRIGLGTWASVSRIFNFCCVTFSLFIVQLYFSHRNAITDLWHSKFVGSMYSPPWPLYAPSSHKNTTCKNHYFCFQRKQLPSSKECRLLKEFSLWSSYQP